MLISISPGRETHLVGHLDKSRLDRILKLAMKCLERKSTSIKYTNGTNSYIHYYTVQ